MAMLTQEYIFPIPYNSNSVLCQRQCTYVY